MIGSVGGEGAKSLSPDMEEDSQRIACLDGTKFFHLILLGKTDSGRPCVPTTSQ